MEMVLKDRVSLHVELLLKDLTLREIADRTGYSKTTVHLDVTKRVARWYPDLAPKAREILDQHYSTKHLRGGKATKRKFKTQNTK